MKNRLFRTATGEDLPRILEIIAQARRRMAAAGSDQWQDGYPARENIEADLARGYGHLLSVPDDRATDKERIIAYGAIVFDGEPAYEALEGGKWLSEGAYVVVHRLAVADEALGHGIGTEFFHRVEQMARERGIGSFRVDTNFDNHRMLQLLAREGFTRCGKVRYRSGEREAFEKLLGREPVRE